LDAQRFLDAQDEGGTFDRAVAELAAGAKRSHWMWFVFPQLRGLGTSPAADHFGLGSVDEAVAYLAHPLLGDRLRRVTDTVLGGGQGDAVTLVGPVDAMKLRSSMTLFARAAPGEDRFRRVLERFFDGVPDPRTLERLGPDGQGPAGGRGRVPATPAIRPYRPAGPSLG
jgi:uncharacterized protein (DUF1810 family)